MPARRRKASMPARGASTPVKKAGLSKDSRECPRQRSLGRAAAMLALLCVAAGARAAEKPEFVRTVAISEELKVSIARGDVVFLFAKPLPGEGIAAFARRFSEDPKTQEKIL